MWRLLQFILISNRRVKLTIETDAHSIDGLEFMNLGVDVARRGWLEEKDIVNTLPFLWINY